MRTEDDPRDLDQTEEASKESFPASDAPANTSPTGLGPPGDPGQPLDPTPDPPPIEVREHPISDPAIPFPEP